MALTHGMNVEAIEKLATDLKTEAGKVNDISSRVSKLMVDAKANWKGKDATQFEDDWNSNYKSKLADLAKKLEDLGATASKNAKQQRETSGS